MPTLALLELIEAIGPLGTAGIILGAIGIAAGAWILWRSRPDVVAPDRAAIPPRRAPAADSPAAEIPWTRLPLIGLVSEPTRLTLGLICIIAGYHIAAWSFPPGKQPPAAPRRLWWIVPLGALAAGGSSILLDRLTRDTAPKP